MFALLLAATLSADSEALIAYDTVQVANRVIAFVPKRTGTAVVSGNSVAVIGDNGVLVVDSGHFPTAARRIIAQLRGLTKKPVRWLVNTHWHMDHLRGNAAYREAFPDVAIIATEATRLAFEKPMVKDEAGMARQQQAMGKAMLESGKGPSGQPLTDVQRKRLEASLRDVEVLERDVAGAPTLPPDVTFTDKLTLHLGGRDAEVLFLGRGNTAGDAVVYLPDLELLISGDLVVAPVPYAFGSFFGEWPATLRKALALGPATIIPGHGPAMHDDTYVRAVADAVDTVFARVKALAQQGASLDEVRERIDLRDIRERFTKGDEDLGRRFDALFLGPGIPRAYREAREGPLHDED